MTEHTTTTIPQDDAIRKSDSPHASTPLSGDAELRPAAPPHAAGGGRFRQPATAKRPLALILAALALVIAVLLEIGVYIEPRASRRSKRNASNTTSHWPPREANARR